MNRRALAVAAFAASWAAGCSGEPGTAALRLRLAEASDCADFCADSQGALIYREGETVPLGDGLFGRCGDPIVFPDLPAGHRVQVRAWVSRGPQHLLEGRSEVVTVVEGGATVATVDLAPVARPRLDEVSPDPAVPGSGAEVVLRGAGFGGGAGWSRVELDGTPLEALSWEDGEVRAALPAGTTGSAVVVRACGIASDPASARVVAEPPGASVLQPPGCPGWRAVAVAPRPAEGDAWVAVDCGADADGYLVRFLGGTCSVAAETRAVPGRPAALALSPAGTEAWVALDGQAVIFRVPLDGTPAVATPPLAGPAERIAMLGDAPLALSRTAEGTVLALLVGGAWEPVAGLVHLDLADVAPAPAGAWAIGRDLEGLGAAAYIDGTGARVGEYALPGCDAPLRVAATPDGRRVVVACGGGRTGLSILDPESLPASFLEVPMPAPPSALALDEPGTGAVAWDAAGGRMVLADVAGTRILATPTVDPAAAPGALARFDGNRFLLGGPAAGRLTVWTPYAPGSPCGTGAP